MRISIIILAVSIGLPACTNAKRFHSDNFLLLLTHQEFHSIQYSANNFIPKIVGYENYTVSSEVTHFYDDMTFNCENISLYLLKSQDHREGFKEVSHTTLDVLHFNETIELQTITQINKKFDNATSISYDWTTKLLYWSNHRYGKYSIKVTNESFNKTEYIILPQTERIFGAVKVYPKRGELFFLSRDNIWYSSNSPKSTASLLFPSEIYHGWIYDSSIDYATDKLYWVSTFRSNHMLNYIDIENTARPFNKADILKIKSIQVDDNPPFNLVVFNNKAYWLAYVNRTKRLYFKNGNKPTISFIGPASNTRLSFVSSRCPY